MFSGARVDIRRVVVPEVGSNPVDQGVAGGAVHAEVLWVVGSVVRDNLKHVVDLEMNWPRQFVLMSKAKLTSVPKIAELLSAFPTVILGRCIWPPDPVDPCSALWAVNPSEMRASVDKDEPHRPPDMTAGPALRGRKLGGDRVAVEVHERNMRIVVTPGNPSNG
jgi:hypothetical protein